MPLEDGGNVHDVENRNVKLRKKRRKRQIIRKGGLHTRAQLQLNHVLLSKKKTLIDIEV